MNTAFWPPLVPAVGAALYGIQNAVPVPPPPPLTMQTIDTLVIFTDATVPAPPVIVQVSPVGWVAMVTA